MTDKKIKWTNQQQQAITQRQSDVLVTASAGTGKTAVLSGRCVDIVSEKIGILNMLVLTFTDAAAQQMRWRIAEQLRAAFHESASPYLRHQLLLLDGADISTLHSFCKRLITEYFFELDIDPTFRVIDADEQSLLKSDALEKTIDWVWQQPNLVAALQQLLRRRDLRPTDGFLSRITQISSFLDGLVCRDDWYRRSLLLAEAAEPFTTGLGTEQQEIVRQKLLSILGQFQHCRTLCQSQNCDSSWLEKYNDTFISPVADCIELLDAGKWDLCAEKITGFDKPRVGKPAGPAEIIASLVQKTTKKAVDSFVQLGELAILNPDYLDKIGSSASLQTKVLLELVKKFDLLYSNAKQTINALDFADLEHYALELLTDSNSSDDELLPSQTALALRQRYKYVFVDEYQDINPVQKAILGMLGSEGNVFVVGDVKQSIYAFRGAQPRIFIEQLKSASLDPEDAPAGLRIDLNLNFRSTAGILDFVNKLFGRIMTGSFAGVDYDESARLRPALAGESLAEPVVELHILDKPDTRSQEPFDSRKAQAAIIAGRIRQMIGTEMIYDSKSGEKKPVQYRDIVILMRSLVGRQDFIEALRLSGVPVSCQASVGYFEVTEVADMLCLLKVLDNPQRDIELAAVLRSPLFHVSDSDLAEIKNHSRAGEQYRSFCDCLLEYCRSGPQKKLAGRLKEILSVTEKWRRLGRDGSLADLLWQVYRYSGLLCFVLALPNGRVRRANLLKLHDRAIQFEGFAGGDGGLPLTRFVEFIEKLQQTGQDRTAEMQTQPENAVRVISVHKSKGLEFPVVFLADLDSSFNKRDLYNDCLIEQDSTLGLQIIDPVTNAKSSSLAHQVIAEKKLSTLLAEEMRILYVATTRARERLILTACEKPGICRDIISAGLFFGDSTIPDWQLRSCSSPLEWYLYGLCDQKALHQGFETGLSDRCRDDNLFCLSLHSQADEQLSVFSTPSRPAAPHRTQQPSQPQSKLLRQIKKSLLWRYGPGDVWKLPAKRSVTQLTHRDDEYAQFDYSGALAQKPKAILPPVQAQPADALLLGSATHLLLARLDLTKPVTEEAVESTKQQLLTRKAITEAAAGHIAAKSIVAFFESDLGSAVLEPGNTIWREWPFTFAPPASQCQQTAGGDETIIVQGIIDMLVRTANGLLVIDFKTDRAISPARLESYRRQLELYADAAGAILRSRIRGKWLYLLSSGKAIEIQ